MMKNTFDPYSSSIEEFNNIVGGRWKLQIIKILKGCPMHYGELYRELNAISHKMLADSLNELVDAKFISRREYLDKTVRVEYALTEKGFLLIPIMNSIIKSMNAINRYENCNDPTINIEELGEFEHYSTSTTTSCFSERIEYSKQLIRDADYVILGLGSGFNSAFFIDEYSHEIINEWFPNIASSRKLKNIRTLNDLFNEFDYISQQNALEYWSFWGKIIWYYCFSPSAHDGCKYILELLKNKDYFILSTNPDTKLLTTDLTKDRFFSPLGNFNYLQCNISCQEKVWNAFEYILPIIRVLDNKNIIDPDMIPICPYCGRYLVPNRYRNAHVLVSSETSMTHNNNFSKFLNRIKGNDQVVLIEIGSGLKLPYIIRYRFENYVSCHKHASLIRINTENYEVKYKDAMSSIVVFTEDVSDVLQSLISN